MKKILVGFVAFVVALAFVCGPVDAAKKKVHKKAVKKHHVVKKAPPPPEPTPPPEPVAPPPVEKVKKHKVKVSDFPEKGWHKGPYLAANVGLFQVNNDQHIITQRDFGSWANLGYGLSFGWDIADWIGPLLQVNFSTKKAQVGDSTGGNNGGAAYPSQPAYTFPVGTFPVEQAREYAIDVSIFAKATLPYFTRASWQGKNLKFIPFAKLGATGNGVFIRAPTTANMAGAYGAGPAVGLGAELLIWKGFFVALDATEHLIFQMSYQRTITTDQGSVKFKLTQSGFKPHCTVMGLFGWHF